MLWWTATGAASSRTWPCPVSGLAKRDWKPTPDSTTGVSASGLLSPSVSVSLSVPLSLPMCSVFMGVGIYEYGCVGVRA